MTFYKMAYIFIKGAIYLVIFYCCFYAYLCIKNHRLIWVRDFRTESNIGVAFKVLTIAVWVSIIFIIIMISLYSYDFSTKLPLVFILNTN